MKKVISHTLFIGCMFMSPPIIGYAILNHPYNIREFTRILDFSIRQGIVATMLLILIYLTKQHEKMQAQYQQMCARPTSLSKNIFSVLTGGLANTILGILTKIPKSNESAEDSRNQLISCATGAVIVWSVFASHRQFKTGQSTDVFVRPRETITRESSVIPEPYVPDNGYGYFV